MLRQNVTETRRMFILRGLTIFDVLARSLWTNEVFPLKERLDIYRAIFIAWSLRLVLITKSKALMKGNITKLVSILNSRVISQQELPFWWSFHNRDKKNERTTCGIRQGKSCGYSTLLLTRNAYELNNCNHWNHGF